ncbi:Hypothetical protein ZAZAV_434 [Cedratvirus Zaza IHUMI]|uniref:Uncharacterized protein n=1 Tax=Cedratvirus Zaza IHUMI TaxID=2126979 RepID=A0A2R8FFD9_9VIRU|nr:Hypothetical protein ZAZAV_434 [Cedratvirus Zaza IHUMI]
MGTGCSKSRHKIDFKSNMEIYESWEKTDMDVEELRKALSRVRFGEEIKECKVLWFRASPKHLVPILVTREDSLEFLERKILPEARNIYEMREKGIRVTKVSLLGDFTEENFYDKINQNGVDKSIDVKSRRIPLLLRLIF